MLRLCGLLLVLGSAPASAGLGALIRGAAKVGRVASKAGRGAAAVGRAGKAAKMGAVAGRVGAVAAGEAAVHAFRLLPADEAGRAAAYLTRAEGGVWRLVPEHGSAQLTSTEELGAAVRGLAGSEGARVVLSPSAGLELGTLVEAFDARSTVFIEDLAGKLHRVQPTESGWRVARSPGGTGPQRGTGSQSGAGSPSGSGELAEASLDAADLGLSVAEFTLQQLGQPDPDTHEDRDLQVIFAGTAHCMEPPLPAVAARTVEPPAGQSPMAWIATETGADVLAVVGSAVEVEAYTGNAALGLTDLLAVQLADPCDPQQLGALLERVDRERAEGVVLPLAAGIGLDLGSPAVRSSAPLHAVTAAREGGSVRRAGWVRHLRPVDDDSAPPWWVIAAGLGLGVLVVAGVVARRGPLRSGRGSTGRPAEDAVRQTGGPG